MGGALSAIGRFFVAIWHDVIGHRTDTGWGIIALIYVGVVALAFAIGGYRSLTEYAKALDSSFDKDKLERNNLKRLAGTPPREIDWVKARTQQVQSLRFTIPFGVLTFGALYWWVRGPFTFRSFAVLAVCWLIFSPLLRVWWIATAVWTERKLVRSGELDPFKKEVGFDGNTKLVERQLYNVSVSWAVRHYLNWGLQRSTVGWVPFFGLLRPLNPLIKLVQLLRLNVRIVRPLVVCAFYAYVWVLSMPIGVFYLTREFHERRQLLRPEWASSHAPEPKYGSGAIPDTPGDAAAAAQG